MNRRALVSRRGADAVPARATALALIILLVAPPAYAQSELAGSEQAQDDSARLDAPETTGEAGTAAEPATVDAPTPATVESDVDTTLFLTGDDAELADPKLEIYGFADFALSGIIAPGRWRGFINPNTSMGIGNLNVYLKSNLSERARSLVELRFTYLPNGVAQTQSDGSVTYTNTGVRDPLELNRQLRWGGVVIERAWVEYDLHPLLTARAGQFLTPYGIWNVDHGSPTIIGIRRPFVVTDAILPERQTGLELYGRRAFSQHLLGYHLTVSNGRGIADEYVDFDQAKALGGRLFFTTYTLGELTLGGSFYSARRIATRDRWTLVDGVRTFQQTTVERSTELSAAADLKWIHKGLHVQAEYMARQRTYDDRARERLPDYAYPAFAPDSRRWGAYALLGYRIAPINLMPFVVLEGMEFPSGDIPRALGYHVGLNYRPDAALVLKAELLRAWFPGAGPNSFGVDSLTVYSTQVAWVF